MVSEKYLKGNAVLNLKLKIFNIYKTLQSLEYFKGCRIQFGDYFHKLSNHHFCRQLRLHI
jgi:hypothetical protein